MSAWLMIGLAPGITVALVWTVLQAGRWLSIRETRRRRGARGGYIDIRIRG